MAKQLIAETKALETVKEDVKDKSLDVYPNPATSYFVVYDYSGDQSRSIELIDINGQLVRKRTASNVATRIDVSDLATGLYILKIKDGKGKIVRTEKILVRK